MIKSGMDRFNGAFQIRLKSRGVKNLVIRGFDQDVGDNAQPVLEGALQISPNIARNLFLNRVPAFIECFLVLNENFVQRRDLMVLKISSEHLQAQEIANGRKKNAEEHHSERELLHEQRRYAFMISPPLAGCLRCAALGANFRLTFAPHLGSTEYTEGNFFFLCNTLALKMAQGLGMGVFFQKRTTRWTMGNGSIM
jgi:hypothetical protein